MPRTRSQIIETAAARALLRLRGAGKNPDQMQTRLAQQEAGRAFDYLLEQARERSGNVGFDPREHAPIAAEEAIVLWVVATFANRSPLSDSAFTEAYNDWRSEAAKAYHNPRIEAEREADEG